MAKKLYKWKRFWCPRDGTIDLGDNGYLTDPDTDWGQHYNGSLRTSSQLIANPCLILLGEPGIGKSTCVEEMTQLPSTQAGDMVLHIDFRQFGEEGRFVSEVFRGEAVNLWRKKNFNLYLFQDCDVA